MSARVHLRWFCRIDLQVIEGSVVTGQSRLVQQMSVTRGIIHAKKTFMTSLGRFKGEIHIVYKQREILVMLQLIVFVLVISLGSQKNDGGLHVL